MQRVSPNATTEILYSKLKAANASIQIAEDRAQRAERDAEHAMRSCASKLETMTTALSASDTARRHAEEALCAASRPDPVAQARVRRLEEEAHAARKALRDCTDPALVDALEEEARFRTCAARQARHCFDANVAPQRPVVAHVYVCPSDAATAATTGCCAKTAQEVGASLARLELSVALGRALDTTRTVDGIGTRHATTVASARERTDNYIRAVSRDLQEGMEREQGAYQAAKEAGDEAVAR